MKWSAKLGRFAGIDVYVHVTFLLLLAWVAYVYWTETGTRRRRADRPRADPPALPLRACCTSTATR